MEGQSIGIKTKDVASLIEHIKQGLPVKSLVTLSKNLGVPEKRMAVAVNISQRTLTSRKKRGRFKADESERVLRLAKLYERAKEVFGADDSVKRWFHSPAKGLAGKTPFEFADTEPGAQEVLDLLGRIEYGAFS